MRVLVSCFGLVSLFISSSLFICSSLFAAGSPDASAGDHPRVDPGPARAEFKQSVILSSPGDRGPGFDPSDLLRVRGQSFEPPAEKASGLYTRDWTFQGPANYAGKVMDLAVTPDNPNLVYAAYQAAGVWKSGDSGTSWSRVTDIESANYVSTVEIAPGKPSTVFVGLGSPGYTLELERGILRSTNGGQTWTAIGPISDQADAIFDLVVDPSDSDHLIAATEDGVFVTTDGGVSWTFTLDFPGDTFNWWNHVSQIVGHPTNGQIAWVAGRFGIFKTTDGGFSWARSDSGIGAGIAIVMAVSQSQPNILYAERENETWPLMDIYRSTNGGDSWALTTVVDYFHQGRYDMAIGVDPADSDKVVLANVAWHESTNGGQSFVNRFWSGGNESGSRPHADHLAVAWKPGDSSTIYSGNDGGVWRTTDAGASWHKVDQGVQANLSFNLGVAPGAETLYLTSGDYTAGQITQGSVDWGTYPGYEWQFYAVDPHDPDTVYTADYTTRLLRVEDGGATRTSVDPCPGQGMRYDRPIDFDPETPSVVYAGCLDLRKSTNRGTSWASVSPQLTPNENYGLIDFAVAPSDPDVIWVLSEKLWHTRDGGATWTSRTLPAYPQDLAVDPNDPSVVYVGLAFQRLQRYSEWGATEQALGGNLPNSAVRRVVVDPLNTQRIFAATDVGIFVTSGTSGVWQKLGSGLPRVSFWDLRIDGTDLFAAGQQGVWRYDLGTVPCSGADDRMCLIGDRFEITVDWRDFEGNTGSGQVVPVASDASGLFWFFGPDNWEMLVKVLDACSFNDHFWVFSAATTTVEYQLNVVDTVTGLSVSYENALGEAAPAVADTNAIAGCSASAVSAASRTSDVGSVETRAVKTSTEKPVPSTVSLQPTEKAEPGPCVADDTTLCLADGKFELTVSWRDFENNTGSGHVVPQGTSDSGLFWFFGPDNWEMLVKVLDACGFNGHHWIFSAATTTVEYQLRVRDTATGEVSVYDNALGAAAYALADTATLDGC